MEWASLFDTEKLLGKQVMVVSEHGTAADPALTRMVLSKRTFCVVGWLLSKVSWEALREALAVLERPSTVEEITDATWKVTHCNKWKSSL